MRGRPSVITAAVALCVVAACERMPQMTRRTVEPRERAPALTAGARYAANEPEEAGVVLHVEPQRALEDPEALRAFDQARRELSVKTRARLAELDAEMLRTREDSRQASVTTRLHVQDIAEEMRAEAAALHVELANASALTEAGFARFEERVAIALYALEERAKVARALIDHDGAG